MRQIKLLGNSNFKRIEYSETLLFDPGMILRLPVKSFNWVEKSDQ